ncbi:CoA transferase [Primorskyibacter flagellatus]|uniref:CoA transferase n=1 Tax=Primorskyibacter flagellatus TaxID=1387277 RepID=A0A917AG09_9RHOB|nr:CaiB/BaiF CoA-transferase family protein [Primorskyibacter flagellatus]GGE50040.1 CoA transferase [Primorskyibacter flagellatus]
MKPLAGKTVLDLGIITAGAATSALLCDMGAEVIKIESPTYRDPFRIWVSLRPEDRDKTSPHFGATNRGKKSVAINLKDPDGRRCFLDLVRHADVVVENFRRGVLDKLGIGFDVLKQANPAMVLASISSQGEDGPGAGQVSYGSTLECVAGMAWHLGYDDSPMVSGVDLNYPDQVVAMFAAGMIVNALTSVRDCGEGVHLDLAQRELTSFMIGDAFAAPDDNPVRGNADPAFAVQDCFACADGRWIAVSLPEPQVETLVRATGARDAQGLARWCARRDGAAAEGGLQAAGIAAALSLRGEEVLARQAWSSAMIAGPRGEVWKGTPFDFGSPLTPDPVPEFGADTTDVLQTLGGMGRDEIEDLNDRGSIVAPDAALVRTR